MKQNKRCSIVLAAVLAATLACNLPIQVKTPVPTAPTSAGQSQPTGTLLPSPLPANTTPAPSATPAPSETALPLEPTTTETGVLLTDTPIPTGTPTETFTPTRTATRTRSPFTPTAPPTLTPLPKPTRTRTAKPNPPSRTVFTAAYLSEPPVLDGIWDEWKDTTTENPARNVVYGSENWTGSDDLDASFRVGWDETYLYLAVKVRDDVYAQNATGSNLYLGDSLEVLLDTDLFADLYTRSLSGDDYQLGLSPGNPGAGVNPEAYLWFPRGAAGARGKVKIAAVRQEGITRIEARIPWNTFGVVPAAGDRYGFALSASDNDTSNEDVQESMVSSASRRVLVDPTTWNELRLK